MRIFISKLGRVVLLVAWLGSATGVCADTITTREGVILRGRIVLVANGGFRIGETKVVLANLKRAQFELPQKPESITESTAEASQLYKLEKPSAGGIIPVITVQPPGLTRGLVAYYPFKGNANDASGNDNHGSVNGATLICDRNGNANSAYYFDAKNDYIETKRTIIREPVFTCTAWIQLKSLPVKQQPAYSTIIIFGYSGSSLHRLDFNLYSADWSMYADGSRKTFQIGSPGHNDINSGVNTDIPGGKWVHVAVTSSAYQSGEVFFYLNGEKYAAKTKAGGNYPFPLNNSAARIGTGGGRHFNGGIDDLRVYNRALSAAEINQLYDFEKLTAGLWAVDQAGALSWDGSFIARKVVAMNDTKVSFEGTPKELFLSTVNTAAVFFGKVSLVHAFKLREQRQPGVLLASGDFVQGSLKSMANGTLLVDSVLFGRKSYAVGAEVVALWLRKPQPVSEHFTLRTRDGSILLVKQPAFKDGALILNGAPFHNYRIARDDLVEIRNGNAVDVLTLAGKQAAEAKTKSVIEMVIRQNLNKHTGILNKADFEKVTILNLDNNQLTDVKRLEKLTRLRFLDLENNPDLTKAQIAELQKALPKCKIKHNATK